MPTHRLRLRTRAVRPAKLSGLCLDHGQPEVIGQTAVSGLPTICKLASDQLSLMILELSELDHVE